MQCNDVMLTLVYTCHETDTVADCAKVMRDQKVGFVPLFNERNELSGVVTDRDIVVRVVAEGRPVSTPLREIMSAGALLTCRADEDLRVLEKRMAEQKKARAVVLDKAGHLAGVISLSDIAQAESSALRTGRLLKEVVRRESVSITRP